MECFFLPTVRFLSVRLRPLATVSLAALSVLVFAGCATGTTSTASPSATATVATNLCDAAVEPGAVSDAVTATGDIGTEPTVDFTAPISTDGLTAQRSVLVDGEGDQLEAGDFLNFAYSTYDGTTGDLLEATGYEAGEMLPQQISVESGGSLFGCATMGSRIVSVVATGDETYPVVVHVIDMLSINPTSAWGDPQDPVAGMPTVTLADTGAPTITIPADTEPPAETEIADLKKGDGTTVESGDTVLVQYTGVRWSNGETFDSTWDNGGTPTTFATTAVVTGFKEALEGQTVGSQVLVVMTPEDGYGAGEINDSDLTGETLVFVVDILATQHAAAE